MIRLLALTLLAVHCSHAAVIALSTFDTNAEGWAGVTADSTTGTVPVVTNLALTYSSSGGNPGGFVSVDDPDAEDTLFVSPAGFHGNLLMLLGGFIRFDMRYTGALDYNGPDLVIKGGGTVLRYNAPIPAVNPNTWTTISYTLSPGAGWTIGSGAAATVTDFQTVFAAITDLWITAELTNGFVENAQLDNVSINSLDTDVPEPKTLPLLALGGVLVALGSRIGRRSGT
jgi:hypothetical protein